MEDFDHLDPEHLANSSVINLYYQYDQVDDPEPVVNKNNHTVVRLYNQSKPALTLADLNHEKAIAFYPLFIFFGSIMIIGILCNSIVCYIYRCRSRRATSNMFVIFFAILDICSCALTIPLEILVIAMPYTYEIASLCKITGFVKSVSVCAMCCTLVCVAYDCHRKVCRPKPNDTIGVKKARYHCVVALLVAMVISIPAVLVHDLKIVKTRVSDLSGYQCKIDTDKPLWLIILFYCTNLVAFTFMLISITLFYCLVGVNVWKKRQAEQRGEKPSSAKKEFPKKHRFVRDTSSSSVLGEESSRLYSSGNLSSYSFAEASRTPLKSGTTLSKSNSLQTSTLAIGVNFVQLNVKTTRQAYIFMVISIIFLVSMLPFVTVSLLCAATNVFNQFSSYSTEIIVRFCLCSYLINYIVKPGIYILFNVNFRKAVKNLLTKVWSLCTHSTTQQASARQLKRSRSMGTHRSTSKTPIYKAPPHST